MPNFKYGIIPEGEENAGNIYSYTGQEIKDILDKCIKENHKGDINFAGQLSFDDSSILLIGNESNILTNKQLQAFREELNKYTGKFFYNTESKKWEYIYHTLDIGKISMTKKMTINDDSYYCGEIQFTTPNDISSLYIKGCCLSLVQR